MTAISFPKVSIVMPTYNRVHLLEPVIDSILGQGYRDIELVIIDDGSSDGTQGLLEEIRQRDERLRYAKLPYNRGIGFARDAGLRHAVGQYIALADSDDLWLPGRLQEQVEILERFPEIEVLFGDYLNINHVRNTIMSGFSISQKGFDLLSSRQLADGLFLVESGIEIGILRSNFIAAPTMVLRREVFNKVGGFNNHLSTPVDLEFGWRAAVLGARFAYINRPLLERHVHTDSATSQGYQPWLERLKALEICRWTCKKYNRPDLLSHIRSSEVRSYRNMLRIQGENSQQFRIIKTYFESLKVGFSPRTTALCVLALMGPRAISTVSRLRQVEHGK